MPQPASLVVTACTAAGMRRTRMVADASYRASRLSGMTSRPAIALRDVVRPAGRLAPALMIRQYDRLAAWIPPPPTEPVQPPH